MPKGGAASCPPEDVGPVVAARGDADHRARVARGGRVPRLEQSAGDGRADPERRSARRARAARAGTMLLPVHVLGSRYRVMTYQQAETPDIAATAKSGGGAGRLLVVGTQAGTIVTFRHAATAFPVVTGLPQSSLAGRRVRARRRRRVPGLDRRRRRRSVRRRESIQSSGRGVLRQHVDDLREDGRRRRQSPDMAHEQMPPVTAWSRTYVAAALLPQKSVCDTLLGAVDARPAPPYGGCSRTAIETTVEFTGPDGRPGSRSGSRFGRRAAGARRHGRLRRHRVAGACC